MRQHFVLAVQTVPQPILVVKPLNLPYFLKKPVKMSFLKDGLKTILISINLRNTFVEGATRSDSEHNLKDSP